jgi:hypothetical protein
MCSKCNKCDKCKCKCKCNCCSEDTCDKKKSSYITASEWYCDSPILCNLVNIVNIEKCDLKKIIRQKQNRDNIYNLNFYVSLPDCERTECRVIWPIVPILNDLFCIISENSNLRTNINNRIIENIAEFHINLNLLTKYSIEFPVSDIDVPASNDRQSILDFKITISKDGDGNTIWTITISWKSSFRISTDDYNFTLQKEDGNILDTPLTLEDALSGNYIIVQKKGLNAVNVKLARVARNVTFNLQYDTWIGIKGETLEV